MLGRGAGAAMQLAAASNVDLLGAEREAAVESRRLDLLRAERVIYLVDRDRLVAIPPSGQQVYSRVSLPARPRPAQP